MAFMKCYNTQTLQDTFIIKDLKDDEATLKIETKNNELLVDVVSNKNGDKLYQMTANLLPSSNPELTEIFNVSELEGDKMNDSLVGAFARAHSYMRELGYQTLVYNSETKVVSPYTGGVHTQ